MIHPSVQDRLPADPTLIRSAVNESLRLHAPAQSFFLTVTRMSWCTVSSCGPAIA